MKLICAYCGEPMKPAFAASAGADVLKLSCEQCSFRMAAMEKAFAAIEAAMKSGKRTDSV